MSSTKTTKLPSIKSLLTDSWQTTKGTLLRSFLWSILSLACFMGIFIIEVLVIAIVSAILSSLIKGMPLIPSIVLSVLAMGIILLLLLGSFLVGSTIISVVSYRIIAEYPEKRPFGEMIKGSWKKSGSIVLYFLFSLLFLGSFLFFFVPGVIVAIVFSFTLYEIFLSDRKVWPAMKRSFVLWQENTKELLVKGVLILVGFFLFGQLDMLVKVITFHMPSSPLLTVSLNIFTVIFFFIDLLISYFTHVYWIRTFQYLEKNTLESKKPRMWWVWLTTGLGWLLVAALIALGVIFFNSSNGKKLISNAQSEIQSQVKDTMKQKIDQVTHLDQNQATQLADDTFVYINTQRTEAGKKPLAKDNLLCQYGELMLTEYQKQGSSFDIEKRFKTDAANPIGIKNFKGYLSVSFVAFNGPNSVTTPEMLLKYWNGSKGESEIIQQKNFRAACIVANPDYIVGVMVE